MIANAIWLGGSLLWSHGPKVSHPGRGGGFQAVALFTSFTVQTSGGF